jgi:preprotein translocase subunit SecY
MRDLIEKLRNIFRITELKERILYTLTLLAVFRLGSFIILPGVDADQLSADMAANQNGGGGILSLINIFVGGAFSRGAIFAMGIMPYISASIIMQLLAVAVPSIHKMQREGDSGQKKINQLTRFVCVIICIGQATAYLYTMQAQHPNAFGSGTMFWLTTVLTLTAGSFFLLWMGERITDNGIGNGVSMIIAIGIIAGLPAALFNEARLTAPMIFFVEILMLGIVTMGVIAMQQATRKIPINYARRIMGGNKMMGGMTNNARQYIPLKLNSAGVMPIIFAQSLMFIPATIAGLWPDSWFWTSAGNIFSDYNGFGYNIVFALLIIVFTYFYTAIVINPSDIADNLKRNSGFIPGVKPGKKTAEYIDTVLSRVTLPGSICLAFVAILPALARNMGISQSFAQFYGGTSVLIMIGVVLETMQQIDSYLLIRHYDGLMKTGRVKRAQGAPGVAV